MLSFGGRLRNIRNNRVYKHLTSLLLSSAAVMAFCYTASMYPADISAPANWISFSSVFIGVPIVLLWRMWRERPFRWYALAAIVVIITVSAWLYCINTVIVDTDEENYLNQESDFNTAAALVMPEQSAISSAENTDYVYCKSLAPMGVELTVVNLSYDADLLQNEICDIGNRFARLESTMAGTPYFFSLDEGGVELYGHTYTTYCFLIDGTYYAVAYSCCIESQTISYLFFSSQQLAFMSADDMFQFSNLPKRISAFLWNRTDD